MKIKIASLLTLGMVLGLTTVLSAPPAPVQAQTAAGEEYIVQADDWLSKIADKFYGDVLAYPAIVEATNAKAAEDDSFATITNPDVIEVGQKLFIPPDAAAVAVAPAPAPATDVAGIYKVMLPGASSPGLDITLYLNVDNSMRQVSDYLNGEAPVVEVGTWQAAGHEVTLTVTGQAEQPYDAASSQTLGVTDQGLSTMAGAPGTGRWTYLPFTALARGEQTVPYDPAQAAQTIADNGFTGFYKGFLPAASCCGQDITLSLNFDNTASLTTDYLNGEAPLVRPGTWATSEQNGVTVTLEGAEAPLSLRLDEEGRLVTAPEETAYGAAGLQLYHFEVIATNALQVSLTGTVTYLQRLALPPQAVITVQLVDVSKADAPAEVIAEQVIMADGRQVPIEFELTYSPFDIQSNLTYAVQARIEVDGQLTFINPSRYPVLTQEAPETVEIIVEPVAN